MSRGLQGGNATSPTCVDPTSTREPKAVPKHTPISSENVSLRLLLLAVLNDARVPLPAHLLREAVEQRYKRAVTPSQLTSTVKNERRSFDQTFTRERRGTTRTDYVAPAIDDAGNAVRGWYTSTSWALHSRVLTASAYGEATARAIGALNAKTPGSYSEEVEKEITSAINTLSRLSMRETFFGAEN